MGLQKIQTTSNMCIVSFKTLQMQHMVVSKGKPQQCC